MVLIADFISEVLLNNCFHEHCCWDPVFKIINLWLDYSEFFSWFVAPTDRDIVSPSEIAVLDAVMNGGRALSLKVSKQHFVLDVLAIVNLAHVVKVSVLREL